MMKGKWIWALIWIAVAFAWENGAYAEDKRGLKKEQVSQRAQLRWKDVKKRFDERAREKDPFGANMDPGTFVAPVVTQEASADAQGQEVAVVPLQEAVDNFYGKVTIVDAKKQLVMVGDRELHPGDLVKIEHKDVVYNLRIVKITVNELVFMNTENKEEATVRLDVRIDPTKAMDRLRDSIFGNSKKAPLIIGGKKKAPR